MAGTGAFSRPVYAGACDDLEGLDEEEVVQIGSISATCSGNPWEGKSYTVYRTSMTDDGSEGLINTVGPCEPGDVDEDGGCVYDPSELPQFQASIEELEGFPSVIEVDQSYEQIQETVNAFCETSTGDLSEVSTTAHCSAELRIKGSGSIKNKFPG